MPRLALVASAELRLRFPAQRLALQSSLSRELAGQN